MLLQRLVLQCLLLLPGWIKVNSEMCWQSNTFYQALPVDKRCVCVGGGGMLKATLKNSRHSLFPVTFMKSEYSEWFPICLCNILKPCKDHRLPKAFQTFHKWAGLLCGKCSCKTEHYIMCCSDCKAELILQGFLAKNHGQSYRTKKMWTELRGCRQEQQGV